MRELILEIVKKIELDKVYIKLCQANCNFDDRYNLERKEIEPVIKSFDPDFKYISKDKTFLKEIAFKEFTVRFFIGYRGGIVDFAYLVWKEGENHNFYKGRLASLAEQIDSEFGEKVKYKTPIATSLEDFKEILSKFFELFESFKQHLEKAVKS